MREDARQQRADRAADAVGRHDVQRVVERRLRAPLQAVVAGNGGQAAQDERAHRTDVAGGRRDGHEPDDDRRRGSYRGGLPRPDRIEQRPDDQRRGRGEQGGRERERRALVRRERAAGIEAEPPEPQQPGAENRERHIVRQHEHVRIPAARAYDTRRHQRGRARVHVHDGAAGKIERTHLSQPAAAPDPVRDRAVHDDGPQADEGHIGREAHAPDDGAGNQGRGDDREGGLVGHEQQMGDAAPGLEADAAQEKVRRVADPVRAGGKRERVADDRPQHADEPERDDAHHHRVQDVLGAHQAAVEERQRRCHEQHERCGSEHPCCISRANHAVISCR